MSSAVYLVPSVGQATHVGLVREKNEDSFGWFSLQNGELFIVADGMGGYAGGAEASKQTVMSFKEYFETHSGTPENLLQESLLYADSKVKEIAQLNTNLSSCGSTIVVLFVTGSIGYFIHAGDSRLYIFNKGRLQQIGRDHSAVLDMLQAGLISKEEAEKYPKNIITQSLGGNIDISRCTVEKITITPPTSFLLCTDGLWGSINEDKLISILSKSITSSSKVNLMINEAIDAGGSDNITGQIIEFCIDESKGKNISNNTNYKNIFKIISLVLIVIIFICVALIFKFGKLSSLAILEKQNIMDQKNQQKSSPLVDENNKIINENIQKESENILIHDQKIKNCQEPNVDILPSQINENKKERAKVNTVDKTEIKYSESSASQNKNNY